MRYLVLFLLFLVSFSSYCQVSEEVFPKANTILLRSGIEKSDILMDWGQHLVKNGFEIEKLDKDFLTIKTAPKDFTAKNCNCEFYLFSSLADNEIKTIVKMRFKTHGTQLLTGVSQFPWYDWEFVNKKNNPGFTLFEKMNPIFTGFDNSKVYFTISN